MNFDINPHGNKLNSTDKGALLVLLFLVGVFYDVLLSIQAPNILLLLSEPIIFVIALLYVYKRKLYIKNGVIVFSIIFFVIMFAYIIYLNFCSGELC